MKFFLFSIAFILSIDLTSSSRDLNIFTSSGEVLGRKSKNSVIYEDIPYAEPPIGNLRWKAPRKISQTNFKIEPKENNFCVQRPSNLGGADGDTFMLVLKTVCI